MEWRECQVDIDRFNKMTIEEIAIIVKAGEQSEFWKYVRSRLAITLMSCEQNLIRTRVNSLDDTIKLARFAEVYKSADEIFNIPNMVTGALKLSARPTPQSVKKGE